MKRLAYPSLTLLGGAAVLRSGVTRLLPCFRVPDGQLAPGVTLTTIADPRGPWSGKVVTVAPQAAWRLDTVLGQNALPGLETTSSMARRTAALVAVNGDFALPGGRPVHAFAKDGRLVQTIADPGGRSRFFAVESQPPYLPHIGTAPRDVKLYVPSSSLTAPVLSVNRGPGEGGGLALTTVEAGPQAVAPANACAVRLRRTGAPALREGRTVQGYQVVDERGQGAARCAPAPLAGAGDDVLTAPTGSPAGSLVAELVTGEAVEFSWSLGWPDVRDALGGSPVLVQAGAVIEANVNGTDRFSQRNPRTAVGHRSDGTVLLVTVSGRGADGSAGMTLRELAGFFVRLGASDALNLDGGGSTTLVIDGEVQNSPSDGLERAVSSALVLTAGNEPTGAATNGPAVPVPPLDPLTPEETKEAREAQVADPGSTGGLLPR
jgi:hypothetical protein